MAQDELPIEFSRAHAHLRLAGAVSRGPRIKASSGFGEVKHPDQKAHGRAIEQQVAQLRAIHARRVPVLGVDPELVLVLHVNGPLNPSSLNAAKLHVLELLDGRVVVAAPDDQELTAFLERVREYGTGPRPPAEKPAAADAEEDEEPTAEQVEDTVTEESDQAEPAPRSAPYQGLLDRIDEVRAFGPQDVPTPELATAVAAAAPTDPLRVDLQCWCPEDADEARSRHEDAGQAVVAAGGQVLDSTLRHTAGLSLLRAEVPAEATGLLAETGLIRRIDVLPRADLGLRDVLLAPYESLPQVTPPADDAPVVAIVDSGVQSAHPLLAPAVRAVHGPGFTDGFDADGHGTFVASLALHGSLEDQLIRGEPMRPVARLVSIRVLDDNGHFPDARLWEKDLLNALELAADEGARVVNLSIGDDRAPYASERPTPLGAAVDEFARRRGVVVVVSAGNFHLGGYPPAEDLPLSYPDILLTDPAAGLLDPATSALSLTVGALDADDNQGVRPPSESVDRVPMGGHGRPSPVTRRGPGPRRMIKPELAAPGGGAEQDTLTGRAVTARHGGVVGAAAVPADRLLTLMSGTSMAAPLVTHAALTALAENPDLTANAVRALVLISARPHDDWFGDSLADGPKRRSTELLGGYGRPDAQRAAHSTDHRAVLLAEGQMPTDGVHLYRVQIPSTFFESGGWRRLAIALAYDPEVRATRQDHLSSNMHVHVYRGLSYRQVAAAYILEDDPVPDKAPADADATDTQLEEPTRAELDPAERGTDADGPEEHADAAEDADEEAANETAKGPKTIRGFLVVAMQPAEQRRSRGTNQYATRLLKQALKPEDGLDLVIAVHNKRNWAGPAVQGYALTLAFERDLDHAELYADLQAFVEAQATLEAELPMEVVLRG